MSSPDKSLDSRPSNTTDNELKEDAIEEFSSTSLTDRLSNAPVALLADDFGGRHNELEAIVQAFSTRCSSCPSRCIISGPIGVGKTQLALKYAKDTFDNNIYSKVIWLSASSRESLFPRYPGVLDVVFLPDAHEVDGEYEHILVESLLKRKWLIVVDGVEDNNSGQIEQLEEILPRIANEGDIIFTVRDSDIAATLARSCGHFHTVINLDTLDAANASRLLVGKSGSLNRMDEEHIATDLVQSFGCLPLAVTTLASYMKQSQISINDLYTDIGNIKQKTKGSAAGGSSEDAALHLTKFTLSHLAEAHPHLISLLQLLSFLHHDNIPLDLLTQNSGFYALIFSKPEPPLIPVPELHQKPKSTALKHLLSKSMKKILHADPSRLRKSVSRAPHGSDNRSYLTDIGIRIRMRI